MGVPFSDITLYIPTPYSNESPQYLEETSLQHFVSDLYVTKMNGYKPPNTTRVCIQPGFYKIWDRTWKNGSLVSIAPEFLRDKYESLNRQGKYQYILDLIQDVMIQLSAEYNWDKSVFEIAYKEVITGNFIFRVDYPRKMSRDKKKIANLCIEKTETVTSVYLNLQIDNEISRIKLFDKKNTYWYDCAYLLAKYCKWFDLDRFGMSFKGKIEIWYSIKEKKVKFFEFGNEVVEIDFGRFFTFGFS